MPLTSMLQTLLDEFVERFATSNVSPTLKLLSWTALPATSRACAFVFLLTTLDVLRGSSFRDEKATYFFWCRWSLMPLYQ